ncbi:MAG TPA: glucose-1-phosphate thymidylyltransferase, partial [Actinobacteria bacterium]|nr:glucose-1-phosphate thymidylyltransferase [Actinomycetota bacterium]
VYMFDKSIMKAVNSIKPSNRNDLEITDAIQHLIDSGHEVEPHVIKGWWKDTGKLEDMLEANRMMLEGVEGNEGEVDKDSKLFGSVRLEKGSKIINSVIRGPVTIGENTVVDNSYIGPFSSIYYDCVIKNSEIEHSIILEKSSVSDMHRIEDSLVGKNVTISKTEQKPKAYRLMLGDSSNVEVI